MSRHLYLDSSLNRSDRRIRTRSSSETTRMSTSTSRGLVASSRSVVPVKNRRAQRVGIAGPPRFIHSGPLEDGDRQPASSRGLAGCHKVRYVIDVQLPHADPDIGTGTVRVWAICTSMSSRKTRSLSQRPQLWTGLDRKSSSSMMNLYLSLSSLSTTRLFT